MEIHQRAEVDKALKLIALFHGDDFDARQALEDELLLPMETILAKVPGYTKREKFRAAQVSKMTWYRWECGHRPSWAAAKQLAKITGIPATRIGYE